MASRSRTTFKKRQKELARMEKQRHETMDRMIAVRFEIPVAQLDARKRLKLKIVDVDGPAGELIETK